MQRVILHPPTLSSYLSPSALSDARAIPQRPRHRIRQPIVSTAIVIYRLNDLRFRLHRRQRQRRYRSRPRASWSFGAIHQCAIARISSLTTAAHRMLVYCSQYLWSSLYSHLISYHTNFELSLLNYPCRNYIIKTILLRPWYKFISY